MKLLLTLGDQFSLSDYRMRKAARAAVFDHEGNLALLHVSKHHYYKLPGGGIEVRCGPGGHSIYCRARVGARFEVTGEFEVVGASGGSFQAGLVMGLPNPHDPACNAFEIKRDPTEGAGVSYSSSRNGGGRLLPATINVGNNTFNFRMAGTNATASVNGVPVLRNARVPSRIHSQGNQILAGLGAADGFSQTAIRYRNVKLRRLPGSKAAEQEE